MLNDELDRRFRYHAPTPDRAVLHEDIRASFIVLAQILNETLPEGREKSLALTQLQDAMMWSNAAVACSQPGGIT